MRQVNHTLALAHGPVGYKDAAQRRSIRFRLSAWREEETDHSRATGARVSHSGSESMSRRVRLTKQKAFAGTLSASCNQGFATLLADATPREMDGEVENRLRDGTKTWQASVECGG
jgi:hypothetical protein